MQSITNLVQNVSISLAENNWAIVDDLLSHDKYIVLKERFEFLQQEDEFIKAGIGKQIHFTIDDTVRGDYIRWIDTKDTTAPSYVLFEFIEGLIQCLNETCFLGIKDYETHYAFYPQGKGYEKHRDRFKNNPHRIVSFVFYLNDNWQENDGGELVLYNEDLSLRKTIAPLGNRLAVFTSETIHEVMNCNTERKSITGWMLNKPKGLTFL